MKFTQPSEATNAFHNSEMMGKNMVETLTWVVDKFDACLVSTIGKYLCFLLKAR